MTTISLTPGTRLDLFARQGCRWRLPVTWTSGTPAQAVNLSGAEARMQVRRTWADDDPGLPLLDLSEADGIALGGVAGTIEVTVDAATTEAIPYGSYVWELTVGQPGDPIPLLSGTLTVGPQVERAVPA